MSEIALRLLGLSTEQFPDKVCNELQHHGNAIEFLWRFGNFCGRFLGVGSFTHGDYVVGKIIGKLLQDLVGYRVHHTATKTRHLAIHGDFRATDQLALTIPGVADGCAKTHTDAGAALGISALAQ